MTGDIQYTEGTGNVFKDLEFENPGEELAKAKLASAIYDIIENRKLTQEEIEGILNIDRVNVSLLENGRLADFSIEHLFSFLLALDQDIDIVIHPRPRSRSGGINVTTAYALS
jgi:predicted XRE-type DNA-binding protein